MKLTSEHRETFEDRPRSWAIVWDDGLYGCLPAGWYAHGLDKMGRPILAPFRHEYGPFKSWKEAAAITAEVDASFFEEEEV